MSRYTLVCLLACVALDGDAWAQAVAAEFQQNVGTSSEAGTVAASQVRVFGEPLAGVRFKVEGSVGHHSGKDSDLLGTAYPYEGGADVIEAYGEYLLPPGRFLRSLRGGRYRTPFGISSASEHAYVGFLRPPLIRYGEYYALSSGYLEHGVDVVVGVPQFSAELSVGRPADVGEAISGGRLLSSRTQPSANRAGAIFRLAAMNLGRTQTALGAFHRRLAFRIGKAKAVTATARKLAVLVYRTLKGQLVYVDPGADAYNAQDRTRVVRRLRQRAEHLGFGLVSLATGEVVEGPVS